ncbi:RdgB/HAM1 family non-canonical purine NTP pyrophosphatase [Haladaptatus sp. DYSN1]|uniref:RdgB/HAM1 family non-canonical purine NTP pyrophosphatase n=1 Tax=unclassified Haladaptatus TaxID=2622732 RepID=UPI0024060B05|nr:RdgB/HAM1 family non-canonical purine NTP pyrophosphatase [Haladaptatus sp. DYSN1]
MLRFVTGNEGKVREAETYLTEPLAQADFDYTEIQSDSLAEIALHGAREAFDHLDGDDPIIVDDSGLFIDALGGFPGPYSAYVEDTVGVERVWNLTEMEDNRRARFRSVVAYYDGERAETFEGSVRGRIVAPRGEGGFGYDPIFEHNGTTLAEMDVETKNSISHRGRALAKFAEWFSTDGEWNPGVPE